MNRISYVKTKVFYVEKYKLKKPQAEMHYHHSYELYYVIEGEREYFVGDKFFVVHKGDFIFIPKGMLHRTDGRGATRILSYFQDYFLEPFFKDEVLHDLLPSEPFVFHPTGSDTAIFDGMLSDLLQKYEKYGDKPEKMGHILMADRLFSLLIFVRYSPNSYTPGRDSSRPIESIIQYVNNNHLQISGIREIADYAGITKSYLCHLFKEHLGVSLITYLNTLKIRTACDLIREGKYSMIEIAFKCGFNSAPYFCTVFKGEKGMTPSEYAKLHQQDTIE